MSDILLTVEGLDEIAIKVTNGDTVGMEVTDATPVEIEATGGIGPVGPAGATGATGPQGPTGPAGPIAGADKQVQFNDAGTGGVDTNFKWDKNTKTLRIGIEDDAPLPNNPIAIIGAIDSYLQVNVRNTTEGAHASSDYVATADNGNDESYYLDIGINSSIYQSEDFEAFKANDSYVIAKDGDLDICSTKDKIRLIVGGTVESDIIGEVTSSGLAMQSGKSISIGGAPVALAANRPEIYSGTSSPPDPAGLADGALFFKYTP